MTWQDRTGDAAYTSPGGTRSVFDYVKLNRSFDKNTSAYTFPGVKGTFIQDQGNSDHIYPMRAIFSGDDHDLRALAFEASLKETGRGRLEHPRDGLRDVVPFGTITFREDLVSAANQTVVELEFWEATIVLFPSGAADPFGDVVAAVAVSDLASAADFAGGVDIVTAFQRTTLGDRLSAAVGAVRSTLGVVSSFETAISRQFNAIAEGIQLGIDTFIAAPLNLAQQTQRLLQLPSRIKDSIGDQLDGYRTVLDSITGADDPTSAAAENPVRDTVNDFRNDELFAMAAVSGSILSVVNTEFKTRPEVIAAAAEVVDQFEAVNTWREINYEGLGLTDTGEAYQALQDAVALTSGLLIEISFTLAQERRIVLDRARNMVELVAELYGTVDNDDRLDFFINTNDLSGDEIIELPAGREVVFYL